MEMKKDFNRAGGVGTRQPLRFVVFLVICYHIPAMLVLPRHPRILIRHAGSTIVMCMSGDSVMDKTQTFRACVVP